jgi:hypothetical protein
VLLSESNERGLVERANQQTVDRDLDLPVRVGSKKIKRFDFGNLDCVCIVPGRFGEPYTR